MQTKRTCLTCTSKGVNKDETPLWSKKNGLYSMLPKVLNCTDTYNAVKNDLKETSPKISGTKLTVETTIQEKDTWVFYWAAEAGMALDGDTPDDPATSYGDESNHGVCQSDADGLVTMVLNCPKLYKEGDTLYPRHVHYSVLTKDKVWTTQIGTVEIVCQVPLSSMKQIVKKKTYIVINALSKQSFEEQHIPNSILCHHKTLESQTTKKRGSSIKKLILIINDI